MPITEKIEKIIVAKYDEDKKCFAPDGDLLFAAFPKSKSKIKLRKSDHFFVGIRSGKHSIYGWVQNAPDNYTIEYILNEILSMPSKVLLGNNIDEIKNQVELTLNSIMKLEVGTPVVCDFKKKSFNDKTEVQTVHRVIFF
jgi:hypothetical protein